MIPYARLQELAAPLFSELFQVRVTYKNSMSIDELKRFGMVTTGDKRLDAQMYEDEITRYIKICDMVQYYRDGIPFTIHNRQDAGRAFQLIHAYLYGYVMHLSRSINVGNIPIDDLMTLDALAVILHPYSQESSPSTQAARLPGLNSDEFFLPEPPGKNDKYQSVVPELSRIMDSKTSINQSKADTHRGKLPWS